MCFPTSSNLCVHGLLRLWATNQQSWNRGLPLDKVLYLIKKQNVSF